MVVITQEKQIINFISIMIPYEQNLGTIRVKTDAKSFEKNEDQSILRLFENNTIKHNITNSRKNN